MYKNILKLAKIYEGLCKAAQKVPGFSANTATDKIKHEVKSTVENSLPEFYNQISSNEALVKMLLGKTNIIINYSDGKRIIRPDGKRIIRPDTSPILAKEIVKFLSTKLPPTSKTNMFIEATWELNLEYDD